MSCARLLAHSFVFLGIDSISFVSVRSIFLYTSLTRIRQPRLPIMRGCRNRLLPFSYRFLYVIRVFLLYVLKGPLSCTYDLSCLIKNTCFFTLIFRFLNGPKNSINLGWLADFLLISHFVVDVMRSPVKKLEENYGWTKRGMKYTI
jgi:hypothetical protein